MTIRLRALFAIFLALPALSQQPSAGTGKQAAKAITSPSPPGLTVEGVLTLVEAGLSDDLIIARLRREEKPFDLSTGDMIRLKKAKVSDNVVEVMLDPKAEIGTKPVIIPTQPVAIPAQPVAIGLSVVHASGATPAPGLNETGDPNDPMTPHDSGIYLLTKDRYGKPQMTVLERASYQGSKTGGMLGSAMTYGIKKIKTKAVIPGPRASIRATDRSPVFYFYFEDKQAGLGKSYFGVGNLSNPNQFALLKLDVNKSNRETTVGQFGTLGMSSGNDTKAMIPFKSERLRTGLYKVVVEDLSPGEYCFLASSNAGIQSPYGATAMLTSDIFDFGESIE